MNLALDIGNSAIKGGSFDEGRLVESWRIAYDNNWEAGLASHLRHAAHMRAGVACVVPRRMGAVMELLGNLRAVRIHAGLRLPFTLAYRTPETLGADRLAAAAAAWHLHGGRRSVVAIDAGTAVNFEVIDTSGTYRGGAIACGPLTAARALARETAQLPQVDLELPAAVMGTSTREALRAGVMAGFADAVAGMLHRISDELGECPFVVATGGWSAFLARHVRAVGCTDPHLVLRGIDVLLGLNPDAAP